MSLSQHDQQILSQLFNFPVQSTVDLPPVKVSKYEIEAISAAESGDYNSALDLIEAAVRYNPSSPSALNNKAQILRLTGRNEEAMECLNSCLELCTDLDVVKRAAHAQRAWLHYRDGRNEAALADFESAARLGCTESQRMAVKCNPFAKLCNEMVLELMNKYYSR